MLKTILSVSGKPGLFKLVSSTKNMIIVEALSNGKKSPIHTQDKIVSLGDISIYTMENEVPLREVLVAIKEKEEGKEVSLKTNSSSAEELLSYMKEVLPDYDNQRVYPTDVKKMINWYNLLIQSEVDFEIVEESEEEEK